VICPKCGAALNPDGHCPSCSAVTCADELGSASTAPIAGPPPRALGLPRVEPGQRFGERYTLIEEIGAGGMGQVYKAIDVRVGKTVALKLVRAGFEDQDQTVERFRRELSLAQEVTHPNVCRVHDLGESDGTLFISMEFVDGQSLDDLIQSVGTLSTKQTIAIGRQVCAGLEAIHARHIVHRDLKPANIMLDRSGHAIVMDFGLAYHNERDRLTGQGAILGTLAYISPEQAHGQPTDARTDIYAVGLVLFEMLTGKRAPGDGGSAPLALRAPGERCPPPSRFVPEVPPEMSAIVLRCLERDPAHRYASAAELDAALARLSASLSSGVRSGRLRPLPGRAPVASLTAAAVVIVALGSAGGWITAHRVRAAGDRRPVVAVMALDNVGKDPADEYLGVGIADTLITRLAGVPAITVVSRSAALEQRGRPTAAVARELGASYLVNGGVQRADHRLRVTLNLVRPDDSVAWGEELEGTVDDVFALHRKAAENLTEALQVSLTDADRRKLDRPPTSDAEAYASYARARALLERPDVPGSVARAIEGLQRAIQRDPRFALAQAALGEAYWARYVETSDEAWVARAQAAITEALRLEPDQPLTRIALAQLYRGTNRADAAADELRQVVAAHPSIDEAHRLLGEILVEEGEAEEAVAELRKAIDLRPDYWRNHASLAQAFYRSGRYPEAARVFQHVTELQPDNSRAFQMVGASYSLMGDDERALASYRKALELSPDARAYSNLGTLQYRQGKLKEAERSFEEAARLEPGSPAKYRNLGDVYARQGRPDAAREAWQHAVDLAERMLRVNPGDARTLGLLAVAEAKLGRREAAAQHAGEALRLAPADGEVLYRKAVVDALSGRGDTSLATLGEALARGYSVADAAGDDDFGPLRDTRTFRQLVGRAPVGAGKGGH
jgi:eukaryotic-like serine/threonine-protein kinase